MNSFQKRWGHLTVLKRTRHSLRYRGKHMGEFAETWTTKCDCGNVIDIDSRMFPGRAVMRSCGLANCRFTTHAVADSLREGPRKRGRPKRSESTHQVSLHVPNRVYEMVCQYHEIRLRKSPKLTKQDAFNELIVLGWESLKSLSPIQPKEDSTKTDTSA